MGKENSNNLGILIILFNVRSRKFATPLDHSIPVAHPTIPYATFYEAVLFFLIVSGARTTDVTRGRRWRELFLQMERKPSGFKRFLSCGSLG
jgi:hypothetical protein